MLWIFLIFLQSNLSEVSSFILPNESPVATNQHKYSDQRLKWDVLDPASSERYGRKRGVKLGVKLKIPTTEKIQNLKILEKEIKTLEKAIEGDKDVLSVLNKTSPSEPLLLKPAFQCDSWEPRTRTCWVDRNIGDTVTFSLSTGFQSRYSKPDIVWKREFAIKGSLTMQEFVINPHESSRNLVIGRRGYELRISPITELEIDDNQFSATFAENNQNVPKAKVNFRIRIVPEDLGFVYIGETLDLSIESFITLPLESMSYHWYTEKEGVYATLPSNMKVSRSGGTLRISELRQEQEGIVACSIYTNKNIQAAKKRFLIKDLTKNKDILKNFSSHNITFEEEKIKRHRENFMHQFKRSAHYKKRETYPKRYRKRKVQNQREANEANVEGDRYTIVRSNENTPYNAVPQLLGGEMDSRDFAMKNSDGQILSFDDDSDIDTIVNINSNREKNSVDDKVAQIVSYCTGDLQCSKHASCNRPSLKKEGFCRCLPGFYGPGIFCREEM